MLTNEQARCKALNMYIFFSLHIRENGKQKVCVAGLMENPVQDVESLTQVRNILLHLLWFTLQWNFLHHNISI